MVPFSVPSVRSCDGEATALVESASTETTSAKNETARHVRGALNADNLDPPFVAPEHTVNSTASSQATGAAPEPQKGEVDARPDSRWAEATCRAPRRRRVYRPSARAIAAMCSGVVPQQPPTIRAPSLA